MEVSLPGALTPVQGDPGHLLSHHHHSRLSGAEALSEPSPWDSLDRSAGVGWHVGPGMSSGSALAEAHIQFPTLGIGHSVGGALGPPLCQSQPSSHRAGPTRGKASRKGCVSMDSCCDTFSYLSLHCGGTSVLCGISTFGVSQRNRGPVSKCAGVRAWTAAPGHSPLFLCEDPPHGLTEQQCQRQGLGSPVTRVTRSTAAH